MDLVDGCEAFFSLDAVLELVLFPLFVPDLQLFVVFAEVMSTDLMVEHPHDPAPPVLYGQADVYPRFPALGVVSHASWSHLEQGQREELLYSFGNSAPTSPGSLALPDTP